MEFSATFDAVLWRWDARRSDSWFFVSLPEAESAELRALPLPPKGFGSIPVRVRVGPTTWDTSVFPDAASGVYVLPVKASVRKAAGAAEGDTLTIHLALR